MRRTTLIALFLVTVLGTTLPAQAEDAPVETATVARWEFDVLLNNREIGEHSFEVVEAGDRIEMRNQARFDVKVLFFNAYRYRHEGTEAWQDGCLTELASTTDRNGEEISVAAKSTTDSFVVDGKNGREALGTDCVMSFAYWNPAILEQQSLLNSQTGEYQNVAVRLVGEESIRAGGDVVSARRYDVDTGKGVIKLWYRTGDNRWLALEAPAKGNRTIRYRLRKAPTLTARYSALPAVGERNDI